MVLVFEKQGRKLVQIATVIPFRRSNQSQRRKAPATNNQFQFKSFACGPVRHRKTKRAA